MSLEERYYTKGKFLYSCLYEWFDVYKVEENEGSANRDCPAVIPVSQVALKQTFNVLIFVMDYVILVSQVALKQTNNVLICVILKQEEHSPGQESPPPVLQV